MKVYVISLFYDNGLGQPDRILDTVNAATASHICFGQIVAGIKTQLALATEAAKTMSIDDKWLTNNTPMLPYAITSHLNSLNDRRTPDAYISVFSEEFDLDKVN